MKKTTKDGMYEHENFQNTILRCWFSTALLLIFVLFLNIINILPSYFLLAPFIVYMGFMFWFVGLDKENK